MIVRRAWPILILLAAGCSFDWDGLDPANRTSQVADGGGGNAGGTGGAMSVGGTGGSPGGAGGEGGDGGAAGGSGGAAPLGPWGTPTLVTAWSDTSADDDDPTVTADGLEAYFNTNRTGVYTFHMARRESPADPWGPGTVVPELLDNVTNGTISPDGLTFWFEWRDTNMSPRELLVSTRSSRSDVWGTPELAVELNTPMGVADGEMSGITEDGLLLFQTGGGIFARERATTSSLWGPKVLVTELNTMFGEGEPHLAPSGLVTYIKSSRIDSTNYIFRSERPTRTSPWSVPVELPEIHETIACSDPWVSVDERYMLFTREAGDREIFEARR